MKFSHWELLLILFQRGKSGVKSYQFQCNKTLLKTCIREEWVITHYDETISITEKGIQAAEQIAPLYEFQGSSFLH